MTLKEFIKKHDKPGAIVLLEGKRNVLKPDQAQLVRLGNMLASSTQHILFRSGNASGSDQYFSEGVVAVDTKRLQVITPYTGHRKKTNRAYNTISLDQIDIAEEPEVIYQSKQNKKTEKLIDKYVAGARDRYSIKAAYIIRDTIKVLGSENIGSATYGIFYDDLENPKSGGTGHTMNVCEQNDIPVIDQRVWMEWLGINK
jgi:hypothetical protein